ncbi:D-glycero-alpha-D-manno-heptose-1,7-bisphosphate 7-phosphatase [Castellaniella defragrans]|uniref:D-glycero-alpha-D-manno-heptose-1,7-bisphosphate 7-phosphatase n=1 Tax=Castellaniella defragrans TaxID=75697 RepID=UPI0005B8F6AF|nr:HAD family hydrolase [Castellaniella defragrans]KAB0618998.1 HAD family hydrolase [Castellaniella defragrans]
MRGPAVFLDKDGTVLQDVPYNADPGRMRFEPGARAGLARLARLGMPLIVISNQPGIGLGKIAPQDLVAVRNRLSDMFREAGAALAGFYYCPHHPRATVARYACLCACRKPAPGLLRLAAACHDVDLRQSWFVGDILDDVEAGRRAGCRTILLDNGHETEWLAGAWRIPERIEPDLDAASRWISVQCPRTGSGGTA